MSSRSKSIGLAAGLLGLTVSVAAAFPAQVGPDANLRWGPGTEYPIQVTIPGGSTIEVENCNDEWCHVYWLDYEGFVYRPLLLVARGWTVPYIATYPDYEYYNGYVYGPNYVFRYHSDYHSRRESRVAHHSRPESRARHDREKVVPEAVRRMEDHTRREERVDERRHRLPDRIEDQRERSRDQVQERRIDRRDAVRPQMIERPREADRPDMRQIQREARPQQQIQQRSLIQRPQREVRPAREGQRQAAPVPDRRSETQRAREGGRGGRGG